MTTFANVHSVIRREYFLRTTPSERREFLVDNWDETDIRKVMPITGITCQGGLTTYRFTFSDGTQGAVRARV